LSGHFGSAAYGREELVAEMTAAFLCAECGIDNHVIENEAAYLAGWLSVIKGDPKLIVTAASHAQRAANLILGRSRSEKTPASDVLVAIPG
jgi:antirestriction protein ArdC